LLLTRQSDGLLLEVNEGFSRITGFNSAMSLDQSTLDLGIWVDLNERKHMLELLQRDGLVRDFVCHIRRSDGQIRLCEVSSRPLPIGDDDCILTIVHDITERHQMQEKLLQTATTFSRVRPKASSFTDPEQKISACKPGLQRNHRLLRKPKYWARPRASWPLAGTTNCSLRPCGTSCRALTTGRRNLQQTQKRRNLPQLDDHQRRAQ
jgi:PAS domain S-box-containing protein